MDILGTTPMKRFFYLFALMVLSSSADAGESFSFVVGGHRIRIEAPRHCSSPSCVSVSIPGIYETRYRRDRYDDDDATPAVPAKPPAPVSAGPIVACAGKPSIEPGAAPPPALPAMAAPAAPANQQIAALPPAILQPPKAPPAASPAERPVRPAPDAAPVLRVSHEVNDERATPQGDWQTEGNKGSVRIEPCGRALCGYVLNSRSNAKAESVLINMKPKASSEWSGNIYSRDSGETYYGTIVMKGANSLRVEACALGRFFCSGNVWTRIAAQPEKLMTNRQMSPEPRT
jgi:Uncharacterized protein conserved in bacteria (DUF2147)